MFRMAILLIAASSILTSSYGAGGGLGDYGSGWGGLGIFGAMFFGKLFKKFVSGEKGEAVFSDAYTAVRDSKKDFGGSLSDGFWGGVDSIFGTLGPGEGDDKSTQVKIFNYSEGDLRLSAPLTRLYNAISAYRWAPDGTPEKEDRAKELVDAINKMKGALSKAKLKKWISDQLDLDPINKALEAATSALPDNYKRLVVDV